jgi:hypothetical protein
MAIKKKMQMGGKAKPMSGKVGAYAELEKKAAGGDRQGKLDLKLEKSNYKKFGDGPGSGPSGSMPKPKMQMGGSLKPVDKTKKPGLAKLPTAVRNKMGFKKNGGTMSKKK